MRGTIALEQIGGSLPEANVRVKTVDLPQRNRAL